MSSIKYNIKIGDVFGLLTVIDLKRIKISQSTKIKCICDCGNIKYVSIEDSLKGWNKRLGVGPHMLPNRYKEYGEEYIRKAIELFLTTGDNSHLYMRKGYSKAMFI